MISAPTATTELLPAGEELRLLERCRGGDLAAFDIIVGLYQQRVFNVCYWMLGDREDATDAAQDAFVRAFRALHRFRGDCALGTWLHRIAVNVSLDAAQRRKRAPLPYTSLGNEESGEFPEPADPGDNAQESADRRERRAVVRRALADLPEHHRAVLVLFDIQGHSYEEVAATLELPLGTVKSRLNRARLLLREKLEPQRELFEI